MAFSHQFPQEHVKKHEPILLDAKDETTPSSSKPSRPKRDTATIRLSSTGVHRNNQEQAGSTHNHQCSKKADSVEQNDTPNQHEDDSKLHPTIVTPSMKRDAHIAVNVPLANDPFVIQDIELLSLKVFYSLLKAAAENNIVRLMCLFGTMFGHWRQRMKRLHNLRKRQLYAQNLWQFCDRIVAIFDGYNTLVETNGIGVSERSTRATLASNILADPTLKVGVDKLRQHQKSQYEELKMNSKKKKNTPNAHQSGVVTTAKQPPSQETKSAMTNHKRKREVDQKTEKDEIKGTTTLEVMRVASSEVQLRGETESMTLNHKQRHKGAKGKVKDDETERTTNNNSTIYNASKESERLVLKKQRIELKAELQKREIEAQEREKERKFELKRRKLVMRENELVEHQQRMEEFSSLLTRFGKALMRKYD